MPPRNASKPLFLCPPPHFQDCFFYSLVFDPVQKTLLADQGEIRVGCKYQAEIPDRLAEGVGKEGSCIYGEGEHPCAAGGGGVNCISATPPLKANQTTGTNKKWR